MLKNIALTLLGLLATSMPLFDQNNYSLKIERNYRAPKVSEIAQENLSAKLAPYYSELYAKQRKTTPTRS